MTEATINTYRRLFVVFLLFSILLLGIVMNLTAQSKNGGRMPVLSNYDYLDYSNAGDNHFPYQDKDEVNVWYLTDIIQIPNGVWSVGDFILIISAVLLSLFGGDFIIEEIKEIREEKRLKK